jgi:Metallo-beta-lactamase superfamily
MPKPITEIAPGLHHWTARHPRLGMDVSSYWLPEERVLIDPLLPAEGIDWFEEQGGGAPQTALLSNRHHWRSCGDLIERYGVTVRASRPGMHEFGPERPVEAFDVGDEVASEVVAYEVGGICPDESALHSGARRSLSVADGIVRWREGGELAFVPDHMMDNPEQDKATMLAAYRGLLNLEFEHLLLAHGDPAVGDGREKLREFVEREGG